MKEIAAVKSVIDFRIMYLTINGKHCEARRYMQAALTLVRKLSSSQV